MNTQEQLQALELNQMVKAIITAGVQSRKSSNDIYAEVKLARDVARKAQRYEEVYGRKVFKKSVMVTANYGGKLSTSREDVLAQLAELDSDFLKACTKDELMMFTKMVYISVGLSFPAARDYLEWSRKLTYRIAKAVGHIEYNHPITGFPVHIKDEKVIRKDFWFNVNGSRNTAVMREFTGVCNPTKTSTKAVPAIIHSTDASILMKTSEYFHKPMTLIHDSFGTHPNYQVEMKERINEAMNLVYCANVLQDILTDLIEQLDIDALGSEHLLSVAEREQLDATVESLKVIEKLGLDKVPYQGTWENKQDMILNCEHGFS